MDSARPRPGESSADPQSASPTPSGPAHVAENPTGAPKSRVKEPQRLAATLVGVAPDAARPTTVLVSPIKELTPAEPSAPHALAPHRHAARGLTPKGPFPRPPPRAAAPAIPARTATPEPEPAALFTEQPSHARSNEREQTAPTVADKKQRRPRIAIVAGAFGLCVALLAYVIANAHETTDDAQVDADMTSVSARVTGTIAAIHVKANQEVHAGDLLVELDPADARIALNAARAELSRAKAALQIEQPSVAIASTGNAAAIATAQAEVAAAQAAYSAGQRDMQQLRALLNKAEAQMAQANLERQRTIALARGGGLPHADRDARETLWNVSAADADAARANIEAADARLRERGARITSARTHLAELRDNSPRQLDSRRAAYAAALAAVQLVQARLEQAEADLAYTKIVAPVGGIIGGRLASVGDATAPGQLLLSICRTDELWITANFRETQLRRMRPGQRARVYVDALDRVFDGTVESIGGATGSRFSLLPPENASGNYVKVVQRIPVRIALLPRQLDLPRLRAGMSVVPTVDVP